MVGMPVSGSIASNAFTNTVTAATNTSHFTLNRLYLDRTAFFQSTAESISTSDTIANDTDILTLVSFN
jgi:hypothetical protein